MILALDIFCSKRCQKRNSLSTIIYCLSTPPLTSVFSSLFHPVASSQQKNAKDLSIDPTTTKSDGDGWVMSGLCHTISDDCVRVRRTDGEIKYLNFDSSKVKDNNLKDTQRHHVSTATSSSTTLSVRIWIYPTRILFVTTNDEIPDRSVVPYLLTSTLIFGENDQLLIDNEFDQQTGVFSISTDIYSRHTTLSSCP